MKKLNRIHLSIFSIIVSGPLCVLGLTHGAYGMLYAFLRMQSYQLSEFNYFFDQSVGTFPVRYTLIIYFTVFFVLSLIFAIIYKNKREWLS